MSLLFLHTINRLDSRLFLAPKNHVGVLIDINENPECMVNEYHLQYYYNIRGVKCIDIKDNTGKFQYDLPKMLEMLQEREQLLQIKEAAQRAIIAMNFANADSVYDNLREIERLLSTNKQIWVR